MDEDAKKPDSVPKLPNERAVELSRRPKVEHWVPKKVAVAQLKPEFMQWYGGEIRILSSEEHDQVLFDFGEVESAPDARGAEVPGETPASSRGLTETDTREGTPTAAPPRAGETLVGLFCTRDMREAVLGDLDEKFAELAERRGVRVAKAWYWGQAGRSVLFFAVRWGRRLLELEAILKRIL